MIQITVPMRILVAKDPADFRKGIDGTAALSWAHLSERAKRFDLSLTDLRRMLGVLGRPPGSGVTKGGKPGGGGSPGAAAGGESRGPRGPLPGLPGGGSLSSAETDPPEPPGTVASACSDPADGTAPQPQPQPQRDVHGRRGPGALGDLKHVSHRHATLTAGCFCPCCVAGKLYGFQPRCFVTIAGQAPFVGSRQEIERLQCNLCKEIFEAALPQALQDDGVGKGRLSSYSAHTMVVMLKFLGVMPWHRQQTLQAAIGVQVPDASMSDMCEVVADCVRPVVKALSRLAADAPLLYGDDTGATIFGLDAVIKSERRTGREVERTGCHTSAVIARLATGEHVAVLRIGIQHTGELLDEVLTARSAQAPAPLVMGDASSSNAVTVCPVHMCGCNSHALRRFKALEERYPRELGPLLEKYRAVFKHDEGTRRSGMTALERLDYHRTHSRPLFRQMCRDAHALLERHLVEPNGDLGGALDYLLNHERRLSAFFRLPGAPICNNLAERELRLPVRLRDAAPLFRSSVGAAVAANLWTLSITALMNGVNLFDDLGCLQRHADDVRGRPDDWLPWNYLRRKEQRTAELHETSIRPRVMPSPLQPAAHA